MSVLIVCNGRTGCKETLPGDEEISMSKAGWTRVGKLDFCRHCTAYAQGADVILSKVLSLLHTEIESSRVSGDSIFHAYTNRLLREVGKIKIEYDLDLDPV
jgi:hypothetical protein